MMTTKISHCHNLPLCLHSSIDYIPGYTGILPLQFEVYGKTYGESSRFCEANRPPKAPKAPKIYPVNTRSMMEKLLKKRKQMIHENMLQEIKPTVTQLSVPSKYGTHANSSINGLGRQSPPNLKPSQQLNNFQSKYKIDWHVPNNKHPVLKYRRQAKYISGYSAFIPKHVNQIGAPFTESSHAAQWEFQKQHGQPETARYWGCV